MLSLINHFNFKDEEERLMEQQYTDRYFVGTVRRSSQGADVATDVAACALEASQVPEEPVT